jgi:hypothetical protein
MHELHLVTALTLAAAVPAGSSETTPMATGLPGTSWAMDCTKPASTTNNYADYNVSSDGRLVETLRTSEDQPARKIRNIQIISKNWLLYTLDDSDGEAVNILTFTDEKGRQKSWWSVGNSGRAYILNGKFPGKTDGPPWFTRCK